VDRPPLHITSIQNPRLKQVVKLRKRANREEVGLVLVEGYRELRRALENGWKPTSLFICRECFLGENEDEVIGMCERAGAELIECEKPAFEKIAYRERPEGLLAVGPCPHRTLAEIPLDRTPLILITQSIEKPGNLGTMLRSADAAGASGVIVCDRKTDVYNPNVVRASIGTLFSLPVAEADTPAVLEWLAAHQIQAVSTSPHARPEYTEVDFTRPTAIVVGTEQYGLSSEWVSEQGVTVRIPMLGQADSLNVSAAATILLFEAVRQRRGARTITD